MSYLFDTDVVSNPMKRAPSTALMRRIATLHPDKPFTSIITVGELVYGAHRSGRAAVVLERLDSEVWPHYRVVGFDHAAAVTYGELRAMLEAQGTPLSEPDLRIASIALSQGLTLVTGNTRHFERVPDLQVENWLL